MRTTMNSPVAFSVISAFLLITACSDPTASSLHPLPPTATMDRATPAFSITTIDVTGASTTTPEGIDAAGDIVGSYAAAGVTHGFLLTRQGLTTVDHLDANGNPDAHYTDLHGIAPNGDVVGNYARAGEEAVAFHGFRRTAAGEFQDVHYPGHLYEILHRVLPDGTILGCRHDHDLAGSMKGIIITPTDTTEITAMASMTGGATPDLSLIAGQYMNSLTKKTEGFVIDNGVFTPFLVVPDGLSTVAWDMNPRGDIVGVYRDHLGGIHGFVRTDAGFTTLDVDGATATKAFGTNARGDVVGIYVEGGITHGFLARRVN